MDTSEQAAAYAGVDWSEPHGKIPVYFRERFPRFAGGRVIDLGCGTADVTIRFVRAFPEVTALGVDGSEAMLAFARRHVREAGLDSRITLEHRFLPDAAVATRSFDGVICNSLLHHIADPVELWRFARLCAKPGAPILIVDLLRPADHETVLRLVQENAKDAGPVLQRDFVASLHAAYTLREVCEQVRAAELDLHVEQVDELHFVGWGSADV